jgi:nicotinamidase-related amidase
MNTPKIDGALLWLAAQIEMADQLSPLELSSLDRDRTCLVIIDMINGFAREGLLSSPRVEALIPEIETLAKRALKNGLPVIALSDAHATDASEFSSYPAHCQAGSSESELVSELAALEGILRFDKNSTQGWHTPEFQTWFKANSEIQNWNLVGDCTDISIMQYALILKTYYQQFNLPSRIIVPVESVDTFDTHEHPGDLHHIMGLAFMRNAGVEIVHSIK